MTEEEYCVQQIDRLRRQYEAAIKPYVDMLVAIKSLEMPKLEMESEKAEWLLRVRNSEGGQSPKPTWDCKTIDPSHLRIETFRRHGLGGWSTERDSGVQITHLPTGTIVRCEDSRNQHTNKVAAMEGLRLALGIEDQS